MIYIKNRTHQDLSDFMKCYCAGYAASAPPSRDRFREIILWGGFTQNHYLEGVFPLEFVS